MTTPGGPSCLPGTDTPRFSREPMEFVDVATTREFSYYLPAVGPSHSHRAHRPGGAVPPHFVVGAMSLAQAALARVVQAELAEPQAALEASRAGNKLPLVHLAVLLLGCLPPAHR